MRPAKRKRMPAKVSGGKYSNVIFEKTKAVDQSRQAVMAKVLFRMAGLFVIRPFYDSFRINDARPGILCAKINSKSVTSSSDG